MSLFLRYVPFRTFALEVGKVFVGGTFVHGAADGRLGPTTPLLVKAKLKIKIIPSKN
jgi:hypothetical protein